MSRILSCFLCLLIPVLTSAAGLQVTINGTTITFKDVPTDAWFSTYVKDAASNGIVGGYKDAAGNYTGMFGPGDPVTIAQALKIAVEGAGYNVSRYSTVNAEFVTTAWAKRYYQVGVAEGFRIASDRSVDPNRPATRAEVASIITSAFLPREELKKGTSSFNDVNDKTAWSESIIKLTQDNIVSGDKDSDGNLTGTFRPNDNINRAETVKIVMQARAVYQTPGVDRNPIFAVIYSDSGFDPPELHIKSGNRVHFVNQSSSEMWIKSVDLVDIYPEFDSQESFAINEDFGFSFSKVGSWPYINKLIDTHGGTIVVHP